VNIEELDFIVAMARIEDLRREALLLSAAERAARASPERPFRGVIIHIADALDGASRALRSYAAEDKKRKAGVARAS